MVSLQSLPAISEIFRGEASVMADAVGPLAVKRLAVAGLGLSAEVAIVESVRPIVAAFRAELGAASLEQVETSLRSIDSAAGDGRSGESAEETNAQTEWMFAEAGYVLGVAVALRFLGGAR